MIKYVSTTQYAAVAYTLLHCAALHYTTSVGCCLARVLVTYSSLNILVDSRLTSLVLWVAIVMMMM